jgi:hypothetical protein
MTIVDYTVFHRLSSEEQSTALKGYLHGKGLRIPEKGYLDEIDLLQEVGDLEWGEDLWDQWATQGLYENAFHEGKLDPQIWDLYRP